MANWYYTTNKQQMGPVSWDELRQLAASGLLLPADMVWTDGMAEWVKASRQDGLFEESRAVSAAKLERAPPPRRRERRRDDDEDDDRDDDRRPRAKPKKEGMAVGLKVGLILGGVLFLIFLIACGGALAVYYATRGAAPVARPLPGPVAMPPPGPAVVGGPPVVGGMNRSFTVNHLMPKRFDERPVFFRQGQRVVITVASTSPIPRTDVDLVVTQGANNVVAADFSIGLNSRVEFIAPMDDNYRVRVQNLGPGTANSRVDISAR